MLGRYSRNEEVNDQNDSDINLDSESNKLKQNSKLVGEEFRSLLNTYSREISEITIGTTRMISDEITNQVTRRQNEIKSNLNSQIQNAISTALSEKVLPSIQTTLDMQGELISP